MYSFFVRMNGSFGDIERHFLLEKEKWRKKMIEKHIISNQIELKSLKVNTE